MTLVEGLTRVRSLADVLRLVSSPRAGDAVHLCRLLAAVHLAGLPTMSLRDAIARLRGSQSDGLERVVLHPLLRSDGSGSVAEMAALSAVTAARAPHTILEFGTYDGCSTWHLWANSSDTTRITTVDLPAGATVDGSTDVPLQGTTKRPFLPIDPRVALVEVDTRSWEPNLPDGVDMCFIDAGHSYGCVKNDTEKALSVMNERGVIIWHDAAWRGHGYGINQYVKELRRSDLDVHLMTIGPYDYCALAILCL